MTGSIPPREYPRRWQEKRLQVQGTFCFVMLQPTSTNNSIITTRRTLYFPHSQMRYIWIITKKQFPMLHVKSNIKTDRAITVPTLFLLHYFNIIGQVSRILLMKQQMLNLVTRNLKACSLIKLSRVITYCSSCAGVTVLLFKLSVVIILLLKLSLSSSF